MKKLNSNELRAVDGGYSTSCPICHKKVSVGFINVLILGKRAAYASAQQNASAQHYSYRYGYRKNVTHY